MCVFQRSVMTQQALELGEPMGNAVIGRDDRRFRCLLILWMTVLTVGLFADFSLHFILRPLPPSKVTWPTTAAPGQLEGVRGAPKSNKPKAHGPFFYDLVPEAEASQATKEGPILWKNHEDHMKNYTSLDIKADGFYFLYGKVTLNSTGRSSTVKVIKKHGNKKPVVLELSFDERSNSTGFFGKVLRLEAMNSIVINCTNPSLIKSGTYVGIYKLGSV